MKKSPVILAVVALLFMGATALALHHVRSFQRLGEPGIKTRPMADSQNLEILLPESVPGYISQIATQSETELLKLPPDTSFRSRMYQAPDGFLSQVTAVLMGNDRSSIHKPQICMTGQGWTIDDAASSVENIQMDRPFPYTLTVNKLVASLDVPKDGHSVRYRGLFVYWFVDATHLTANPYKWRWWYIPKDLLQHGVLERWAYVSYFTSCSPGSEDVAFGRLKEFIIQSVPDYQLMPASPKDLAEASR